MVEDRAEGDSRGLDGWEIYGDLLVRLERSGQADEGVEEVAALLLESLLLQPVS